MDDYIILTGSVLHEPEYFGKYTALRIQSDEADFYIIRLDAGWQLKDMLFLRTGQTIVVEGKVIDGISRIVVAHRIKIVEYGIKEEIKTDGTEGFYGIGSGDSPISGG